MECDALSTDCFIDFHTLIIFAPVRFQIVLYQPRFIRTRRIWLGNLCRPMVGHFLEAFADLGGCFADTVESGLVAMENN